jgi:hypothetical protein
MSLFLGSVAAFYIRLSDRNIERIDRQLRRQLHRAKERAKKEREAALRRAMRGQSRRLDGGGDDDSNGDSDRSAGECSSVIGGFEAGDVKVNRVSASRSRLSRRKGFDTIPGIEPKDSEASVTVTESVEMELSGSWKKSKRHLFGSAGASADARRGRRERILSNSNLKQQSHVPSGEMNDSSGGFSGSTMRDMLRTVHINVASSGGNPIFRAGPGSEFLSIRSMEPVRNPSLRQDTSTRKPSFALRVLVQERFAEIIATDIAGFQSSIEIKENTLSVTIDILRDTADKWLVPRRARRAFRAVAFEVLYFVGEHGLVTRGADALFDLSPFEFHALFAPLLAALGDAETMENWLAGTQVLAEVELQPRHSTITLPEKSNGLSNA